MSQLCNASTWPWPHNDLNHSFTIFMRVPPPKKKKKKHYLWQCLFICWFTSVIISWYVFFPSLGLGRGLVYAPALITVGLYFNRLRSFGVGLGTSGVGLGTLVFPPLIDVLFEHYGFQGTFVIMGGLALNLFVTGALFRPLSMHRNIVLGIRYSDIIKLIVVLLNE